MFTAIADTMSKFRATAGAAARPGPTTVGLVGRHNAGPDTGSKAATVDSGCQSMRLVPHMVCARSHSCWVLILAVDATAAARQNLIMRLGGLAGAGSGARWATKTGQ
jgi:hypothetical protein